MPHKRSFESLFVEHVRWTQSYTKAATLQQPKLAKKAVRRLLQNITVWNRYVPGFGRLFKEHTLYAKMFIDGTVACGCPGKMKTCKYAKKAKRGLAGLRRNAPKLIRFLNRKLKLSRPQQRRLRKYVMHHLACTARYVQYGACSLKTKRYQYAEAVCVRQGRRFGRFLDRL